MKTQHQLILDYVQEFGSFIPARMSGKIYQGQMIGSECGKRARELRNMLKLESRKKGRFEEFYLIEKPQTEEEYNQEMLREIMRPDEEDARREDLKRDLSSKTQTLL